MIRIILSASQFENFVHTLIISAMQYFIVTILARLPSHNSQPDSMLEYAELTC